jgi:hypothetical protein
MYPHQNDFIVQHPHLCIERAIGANFTEETFNEVTIMITKKSITRGSSVYTRVSITKRMHSP